MTSVREELSKIGSQPARRALQEPVTPEPASRTRRRPWLRGGRDRGATALENVGILPLALGLGVLMWHVAVVGLGAAFLGQATTEAAREFAITGNATKAQAAARATLPEAFGKGVVVTGKDGVIRVTLDLPAGTSFIPQLSSSVTVVREPS
jgi:pilus assembly protein CpaE